MSKYFSRNYIIQNWNKIREYIFLLLLFSYILLRLYNMSWVVLGDLIPGFDIFTAFLEEYGYPILLVILYISNLIINKNNNIFRFEAVKIVLFILFAVVSFEHITCLVLGAFILCSDFSSIKRIALASAAGIILGTIAVIIASKTGWTGDYTVPRMGREGHFFGFFHYAIWARQVLFAAVLYLVVKGKNIKLIELALFTIIQAIVFWYSTQRLTFVVGILAVAVFILFTKYEFIKINNRIIGGLSVAAFPVAMIGTVWVSIIYDESITILQKINSMISGRFTLQRKAFDILDINLFGQQVQNITEYYFYIDSGYLHALFGFGILLTVVILFVFSYMFWRSCKTNNTSLFSLLITILIYLLVDNPICDLTCCGVVFLFFPILLKESLKSKE